MRRAPEIRLEPLVGAVAAAGRDDGASDEVTDAILDAALAVLADGGLRRCTVEEIAAQGRLGRTTIYRRFDGRDAVIHAALAREVARTFATIAEAVAHLGRFEDRVVEGFLAGLRVARGSVLADLVRHEPELLRLVTVDAGPLVVMASELLLDVDERLEGRARTDASRHTAEVLVRLATSLVIAPESSLPLDDEPAARRALHALLDPLLAPLRP